LVFIFIFIYFIIIFSIKFLISDIFFSSGKTEIDFDEFIEMLKKADKKQTPDNELIKTALSVFDVEGDGWMTPAQLRYSSLSFFLSFIFFSFLSEIIKKNSSLSFNNNGRKLD